MTGGEKAKKSGEYREAIVGNLIKLFGWENATQGVSVPCTFNDKLGGSDKKRKMHGVDYDFQHKSPLRDSTRQYVLISIKRRDGYPKAGSESKNKFKEFLVDLAFSKECFPSCELASHKIKQSTKKQTH